MTRFDRYLLSQLVTLFGFFGLVLVLIFWINKAVRLFDTLIGDGHATRIFLEFSTLILPSTLALVLPIAAFAAAVYVSDRLNSESELMAIMATGRAPAQIMRPVVVFALIVGVMMALLTHFLVPRSQAQLHVRQVEVADNIAARLLKKGEFLHPRDGITVYIRNITDEGRLEDVFLSDLRDPKNSYLYTSESAYLVNQNGVTSLVMLSGLAQSVRKQDDRMSVTSFQDFSFDISTLLKQDKDGRDRISDMTTPILISDFDQMTPKKTRHPGALVYELNTRFTSILFGIIAPLLGFSALMVGSYDRLGAWRQIMGAFLLLVILRVLESSLTGSVLKSPDLWPCLYLPSLLGLAFIVLLLRSASYLGGPWRVRRERPA